VKVVKDARKLSLEMAIGFVGRDLCNLSLLGRPTEMQPSIEDIAKTVCEVAAIFEHYLDS